MTLIKYGKNTRKNAIFRGMPHFRQLKLLMVFAHSLFFIRSTRSVKPFIKISNKILGRKKKGRLCPSPEGKIETASPIDPLKRTILLISHEASQTGAPILAFNLLEKFALRYNVISILLGPGNLEEAFRNDSAVTIGPFPVEVRYTRFIHAPILNACRKFSPAFAIVNSIESREALVPLAEAGIPSVLLVHEFASLCPRLDMRTVAASAGQMVFSARLTLEDAVATFPMLPLAGASGKYYGSGSIENSA